jgi:hypothetical protein
MDTVKSKDSKSKTAKDHAPKQPMAQTHQKEETKRF